MNNSKHVLFAFKYCPCQPCIDMYAMAKLKEDNQKMKDIVMTEKYGSNWKNIFSGMGDQ